MSANQFSFCKRREGCREGRKNETKKTCVCVCVCAKVKAAHTFRSIYPFILELVTKTVASLSLVGPSPAKTLPVAYIQRNICSAAAARSSRTLTSIVPLPNNNASDVVRANVSLRAVKEKTARETPLQEKNKRDSVSRLRLHEDDRLSSK